jgi:hypothetical protein
MHELTGVHARALNHTTAIKDAKVPNMPTHAYCMQYPCVHVCTEVKSLVQAHKRERAHTSKRSVN